MPNRHLSRTVAMQALYEWDFQKDKSIKDIVERSIEVLKNEDLDIEYILKTTQGVISKLDEIDKKIQKAAPQWPLDQIPVIDKTLLRLASYELLYSNDIPPKVAINEAVELGKTYGSNNTSKFVNGVLGTLYKEKYGDEDKDIGEEIKKRWKELLQKKEK